MPFKDSTEGKTQPRLVFKNDLKYKMEIAVIQIYVQVTIGKAEVVDSLKYSSSREQMSMHHFVLFYQLTRDILTSNQL